jgi:hypothetical protein
MRFYTTLLVATAATLSAGAQVLTREDSLQAGLIQSDRSTVVSGYGEAKVTYDLKDKTGEANLTRVVLFVGHRFNDRVSLFTELEVEDAVVAGGDPGGEVALEQAFVKFNINRNVYINAGLFIPRIGIMNENHLPTTYNGNFRPFVEHDIIPSTWRELGFCVYGQPQRLPGFNWSFGIMNGLNVAGIGGEEGIREGRYEGREASASNIALTGSALYYHNKLRFQVSGYYGGTVGFPDELPDSLQLKGGPFGTPVMLGEANIQYFGNGLTLKALGSVVSIPDAYNINRAFGNNAALLEYGAYFEAGYNLLMIWNPQTEKNLTIFGRYEMLDVNAKVPENATRDEALVQQYIVGGITWQPVRGVAVKADYMQRMTGDSNPDNASRSYFSLGVAYSF